MNKSSIKIRKINIDDLENLYSTGVSILETQETPQTWDPLQISEILSHSMDLTFLAMSRKKITGFIIGHIPDHKNFAEIYRLGIITPLKKSGLDEALFNIFSKEALQMGAKSIKTDFQINCKELMNFFKKIGFTESGQNITMRLDI